MRPQIETKWDSPSKDRKKRNARDRRPIDEACSSSRTFDASECRWPFGISTITGDQCKKQIGTMWEYKKPLWENSVRFAASNGRVFVAALCVSRDSLKDRKRLKLVTIIASWYYHPFKYCLGVGNGGSWNEAPETTNKKRYNLSRRNRFDNRGGIPGGQPDIHIDRIVSEETTFWLWFEEHNESARLGSYKNRALAFSNFLGSLDSISQKQNEQKDDRRLQNNGKCEICL